MKQEHKELLLRDLCARLPYGVKCHFKYGSAEGDVTLDCTDNNVARFEYGWYGRFHVSINEYHIKPYLFPMSSMTEEQKVIYGDLCYSIIQSLAKNMQSELNELINWLNANHFDYRNLINKNLAIDCTNLNIY